jgi:hypothetical protein
VKLLAIVIIRLSAILDEASGDVYSRVRGAFIRMQIVAMGLLIIAQAFQVFQIVIEEHVLRDISAAASELCAFEGFWGLYLQVFVAMLLTNIIQESAGEGFFKHTIESF